MTTRKEIHANVESFMNANYPCECVPDDADCDKNYSETDHIIDLVGDRVVDFIESLPIDADRDTVLSALRRELFLPKVTVS